MCIRDSVSPTTRMNTTTAPTGTASSTRLFNYPSLKKSIGRQAALGQRCRVKTAAFAANQQYFVPGVHLTGRFVRFDHDVMRMAVVIANLGAGGRSAARSSIGDPCSPTQQCIERDRSRLIARQDCPERSRQNSGNGCLLYTSPSPRDRQKSRMPSSA